MLQIKYFRGEGYNLQFMPDYRFYCDEKIQRPLSSYYDYPFRTRVWYPYKNLRLYFDYMPSRSPLAIQRKMLKLRYDPVHGYDYSYGFDRPFIPDYRIHRPYDFYFDWPWRYRLWLPNRPFRRTLNKELRMVLQLQYNLQTPSIPYRRVIDYEHVPYTKYPTADLPNYSIYRPVDRYDKWPKWYHAYTHIPEVRYYLNNLLMRDFDRPRHKFVHTYW